MVNISIFNGRPLSEEEIAMGTPDKLESKNLDHHVERCATRYRLFATRQAQLSSDIAQIKAILIAMCIFLLVVSPPARDVLQSLRAIFI